MLEYEILHKNILSLSLSTLKLYGISFSKCCIRMTNWSSTVQFWFDLHLIEFRITCQILVRHASFTGTQIRVWCHQVTSNRSWCMGIKGEMSGTVCVTFTWDMYIWVVYSFCLFCCLFIIVTWWYVWCIVWASGRVGVSSILELELQLNSNFNSGIGIGIGGVENGIEIENSGIGIENRNWIFCNCYHSIY